MANEINIDRIEEEASLWSAKRVNHEMWTTSLDKEFEIWLNQSETHTSIYNKINNSFEIMGSDKMVGYFEEHFDQRKSVAPTRRAFITTSSLVASLAMAVVFWPRKLQAYVTEIGERKQFKMKDGTLIELDGGSKVEYNLEKNLRWVKLIYGAAILFKVGPDSRPFEFRTRYGKISNPKHIIEAKQIQSLNRNEIIPTDVEISVKNGEESIKSKNDNFIIKLNTKNKIILKSSQKYESKEFLKKDSFASWKNNRLVYRDQAFSEVLGDLQRHFKGQILLNDLKLENELVSGTLRTDNLLGSLDLLQSILPINVNITESKIVIQRKL